MLLSKKTIRDILSYCVEKRDCKTPYYNDIVEILNSNIDNNESIDVKNELISKICHDIEYMSDWDKLGRYGNFYNNLKRL